MTRRTYFWRSRDALRYFTFETPIHFCFRTMNDIIALPRVSLVRSRTIQHSITAEDFAAHEQQLLQPIKPKAVAVPRGWRYLFRLHSNHEKVHLPLGEIEQALEYALWGRKMDVLDTFETDVLYCQLDQQLLWIRELRDGIPASSEEFKGMKQCIASIEASDDLPTEEFSVMNQPSSLWIAIEEFLDQDVDFHQQKVYQRLMKVVLQQLVHLNQIQDPSQVLFEIKTEIAIYFIKRFHLKRSSETLTAIVEHFVHARIGVLGFIQQQSSTGTTRPNTTLIRDTMEIRGFCSNNKLPVLENTTEALMNLSTVIPTSSQNDWQYIIRLVKEEAELSQDAEIETIGLFLALAISNMQDGIMNLSMILPLTELVPGSTDEYLRQCLLATKRFV